MYILGGAVCGSRFCHDTAAFRNLVAIPIIRIKRGGVGRKHWSIAKCPREYYPLQ